MIADDLDFAAAAAHVPVYFCALTRGCACVRVALVPL